MSRRNASAIAWRFCCAASGHNLQLLDNAGRSVATCTTQLTQAANLQELASVRRFCSSHGHSSHDHSSHEHSSHDHKSHEKACWSCDFRVNRVGLLCRNCDKIQPVDSSLNYFELLGLPAKFRLEPEKLEKQYKHLQWRLHPDKAVGRTSTEREYSSQVSMLINEAYSVLKKPLSRANYLLALKGVKVGDNYEGTIDEPELLLEVLEAREEVEGTSDPATLHQILSNCQEKQKVLEMQLSAAFAEDDLKTAVQLVTQLTYLARLEQTVIDKLPNL